MSAFVAGGSPIFLAVKIVHLCYGEEQSNLDWLGHFCDTGTVVQIFVAGGPA